MTAKHAAPYDPARDSATPTRDPKHCYRGKRRGVPSQHDREANPRGIQFCHICDYRPEHTAEGVVARRRRDRRGHMSAAHEVRKADLLGQVAALPVLRVVEGGAA